MAENPLTTQDLYRSCDISIFDFETTDELDDLSEIIGQSRALEAIHFGVGIKKSGYNLFALGPTGTGKHNIVTQLLTNKAADESPPMDWCYVNNFERNHRPFKLCLPKGMGGVLRRDMEKLVEDLCTVIPAAFENDDYRNRAKKLDEALKEKQEKLVNVIRQDAKSKNIALIRTEEGFSFAPKEGEEVISPQEFNKKSEEQRIHVEQEMELLQDKLEHVLESIPQWRREASENLTALNREVATTAVRHLIDKLREAYKTFSDVLKYFKAVEIDVIDNVEDFQLLEDGGSHLSEMVRFSPFRRYEVNVLVDHATTSGAPVVYEDNPTFQNLIGRAEHLAMMGALITDFTLIKPGALHRANNGYLIIEAYKILQNPYSWEALKRALSSSEIHIGSMEQTLSLVSTVSLEPEPIPLDIKVVLLGDRVLYYLLHQLDPEFKELFKVAADFEVEMDRTPENNQLYAQLIATLAKKDQLRPLDRSGVARVIEHSSRISDDSEKLSTHMRSVCDLLCEADYWADQSERNVITAMDVQSAINAQIRRSSRMSEQLQESIQRGVLMIETGGAEIGQINALTVIELGDVAFGTPARITAQVRMGDGDVIDIEREVDLGGPLHSKGMMILSGYLGARYNKDAPLALSASVVFEQSYAEIDGDSASSAELYALLSALSGLGIKQGYAVTGSVNQHGQIQAIGSVNEKIEGFFDVCQQRGLTKEQGVIIPVSNVNDLMLRRDVIEAVDDGMFSIYAVSTIDEGIEILTGMAAGDVDENGQYPADSINGRVAAQLMRFATKRHEFGESNKEHHDESH